jgi:VWFA-related protein
MEKRAQVSGAQEAREAAPPTPSSRPQASTPPERFIVFLFDDLHLDFSDLQQMKVVATSVVADSLAASDVAAVVSTSGVSSGLTRDHAKLEGTLAKLVPRQLYRHDEHACPNVDYYQADQIKNKRNFEAFELAVRDASICLHMDLERWRSVLEAKTNSAADFALEMGDRDAQATLAVIRGYVGKMGSLPGQRTLILVSPGFLTMTPPSQTDISGILDLAAHSDVTISALNARGLFTDEPHAEGPRSDSAAMLAPGLDRLEARARQETMMLQEDIMAELADGTGGSFFHNSNDLKGGLESLTAAPEFLYVLQVSLGDVKPDGRYHRLKVKIDREGLHLQARRGYFAPKPQKTEK